MIIEELVAKIGLDFTGAANAAKAVRAIDGIKGAFVGVGGIFAALATSLAANTLSVAGAIDDYSDFGNTVGLSVQTLQTLTLAAEQAGGSFDDVRTGMRSLTNLAGSAAKGNATAAASFAELGVHVTGAGGKLRSTEDILKDVADGLEKLPPGSARVNAAMGLLGRGAIKLIPALAGGSAGLADMRAEAERIGFVLDEQTTERFGKLGDGIDNLKARFTGLRNLLGKAFLPSVEKAVAGLTGFLDRNTGDIAKYFERVGNVVGGTLSLIVKTIDVVITGFQALANTSPILAALVGGAILFAAALLSPAIAVGLLAVAIGILGEDFNAFLNGKDSAIGAIIKKFETLQKVVEAISYVASGKVGSDLYDAFDTEQNDRKRENLRGMISRRSAASKISPLNGIGRAQNIYESVGGKDVPFGISAPAGPYIKGEGASTTINVQNTINGASDPALTSQVVNEGIKNLSSQLRSNTKAK